MSLNSLVNNSLSIGTSNRSLGQGNVFTSVCQSFCSQGYACMPPGTYAPLGMHDSPSPVTQAPMPPGHARPPGMHTPPRDGQCVGGTHPTGMHSCYVLQAGHG